MGERVIRIVLAKTGLDSHDRGVRLVARSLRDSGMEVIYTGLYRTPEEVAQTAVQEDADIVGISIHTGGYNETFTRLRELLNSLRAGDIMIIGGGVIPEKDARALEESGAVERFFGPGTSIPGIIDWIHGAVAARK